MIDIENAIEQAIQQVERLKTEFARASFYQDGFGLGLWIADQLILKNQGVLMLHTTNNAFGAQIKLPVYLAG